MTISRPPTPPGLALILSFAQIDADLVPLVGGKAANLGELTRAGLPVPGGFCLTTAAYRRVVGPALLAEVLSGLSGVSPDDVTALAGLAGRARASVLGAAVPEQIAAAVRARYARLGVDVPVAVRSSATAEDLPFASFAGQQDTFLNVVGADAVLEAIRRCWASLWTDRAVSYRQAAGIDHGLVDIAVVVQRMVDPVVAGVLFTANPVTGRRHETVIDASPGLGEAVVSGMANPDHFVVDTHTGQILERRIGDKRVRIRSRPGGGTESVAEPASTTACLSDDRIRALAGLGRQVQAHYGAPQDTEWALDGDGTLWLTQARPVTTLFPVPVRRAPAPGTRVFLCFSLAQGLTGPITPMGLAAFRLLGSSVARTAGFTVSEPLAGPAPYAQAGQRLFFDITPAVRSTVGRALVPRALDVMEARSAAVLRKLFDDPRLTILEKSRRPLLRHVARVAIPARVPAVILGAVLAPEGALARMAVIRDRLEAVLVVPDAATAADRLRHVERILGRELFPLVPRVLPLPVVGFALLALARKLVGEGARPEDWQAVLRGLPHNVTTEMDLELWNLATRLRGDAAAAAVFADATVPDLAERYRAGILPATAQTGLAAFLDRYGARAVAEIDLGLPRWSDDPTHILGVLVNYLRLADPAAAPDRLFAAAAAEADETVSALVARASARGRLRGQLVRLALDRTRALVGVRELPKFLLVTALAAVRRQLQLVGAELAAAGRIIAADDIFFLDLVEARRGLDGADQAALVADRRDAYDRELRRRHIPRVLLSDGTEPEAVPVPGREADDGTLVGSPASAGTISGPARVILDPVGAHLEPGDILVAPSTDPGWTPLFLTAGGLVMEMGGPNSHGAVVAREYGIPAVVGVPDATSRLRTGQRVTVDGAAGTVKPG